MRSWLVDAKETVEDPSATHVAELVAARRPFWLDIEDPTDEVIDGLADHMGLHPLAVEDAKQFGQHAQMQVYGDVATIVGFGLDSELRDPVEVHCYYTTGFLITLRREPSAAFDGLRRTGSMRPLLGVDPVQELHHLIRALHAPFPELIDQLDERLDRLEQRVLDEPDDRELAEIDAIRHRASVIRRTLTPGRDLSAQLALIATLPGATDGSQLYAHDINDQLQHIVSDLTGIEERCLSLFGLHASIASNRQGDVSRRLTAVATIFLPITFLVGFFGQNFSVLTGDLLEGWPSFLILGLLLNIACIGVTVLWLHRGGWH